MASKSLNLLLNSALVAMAVGLVAFNTGILDPILPSRQVATEAAPESAGSTVAGDATGTKPDASTSDENGDMAQSEAADDDSAGKSDIEATDAGAGRDVAKLSGEIGDGGMEESDARSAGTGIDADAPAKPAGIVPPRFDIVRVEPDGNVIIAGAAAAGSLVEVVTGSRTLGDATATGRGDFAVILSEPLEPGDYIIVLRATSPEKIVAMSTETAIISIPKTEDGDVLAIVDEPGKPSKLIAAPEGEEQEPVEKTETEVAAAGEPDAVTETAAADDVAKSGDSASQVADAEMANRESAGDAVSAPADSTGGDVAKQEEAAKDDTTEMAVVSGDSAGQAADAEMADRGSAGDAVSAAADSIGGDAAKQEEAAKDDTIEMAAVSESKPEEAGEDRPVEQKTPPADDLSIVVEAVEIEGDHVFVAGTANPGKVIRVYANRDLIGETLSSEIGRYLVESTRGLAVGEYIIRADMLEVGSAEVIARAAVPFEREAGEAVAAVAPPAVNTAEDGEAEIHKAGADAESDALSAGPEDGSDTGTTVAKAEPGDETMAAEESMDTETEISGENMASEGGDASADDSRRDEERSAASAEPERTAMAESEMREDKPSEEADAAGGETAEPQSSQVAAVVPGTIEHADFGEDIALTAPKLEKTSGSVIIRRGDTLWRISLRVYGRGIRYTTIYTANRNQIKDPHWIWPGQIFDVPGTSDDGEPANLDAIADRSPEALSSKANR